MAKLASAAVDLTDGEPPVNAAPVGLTGDDTGVDEEPLRCAPCQHRLAGGRARAQTPAPRRPAARPHQRRAHDSILVRVDAIAQQENCVGCDGLGWRRPPRKLPYGSSYSSRRRMPPQNKFAVPEDRGVPGTIVVCRPPTPGPGRPIVVNMMAQFEMGAPNKYKRVKPMPPDDGAATREAWFQQCLDKIAAIQPPLTSIAFPYQIGCGLAGGNWSRYDAMITRFAERCPATQVYICKLTGDGGPTGTGRGRGGGGGGRGRAGDRCAPVR